MPFLDPRWPEQSRPSAESNNPVAQEAAFPGFHPLTANFTQSPNQIVDIKMPGLTAELRYTLHVLARETIGKAYGWGGSPYDFAAISWTRWMDLLELQSRNTVKARLARLEAMGLIEVLPGEQGPWGTTANRYRLRWANDGKAASRTLHETLRTRNRELDRKALARKGGQALSETAARPAANPRGVAGEPPSANPGGVGGEPPSANPPGGSAANPPSIKQNKYKNTNEHTQSVSPSSVEVPGRPDGLTDGLIEEPTDGLTDGSGDPGAPWAPWLKVEASEAGWPEPLVKALEGLLDPPQVARIAERSPWSGEGAWAILQAIQVRGRNLGNRAGTLWNGLMHPEKGAPWLALAGPPLREAGWHMLPEDDTTEADYLRGLRAKRLADHGYQRLPLHGEALEKHRSQRVAWLRQKLALEVGDSPDEEEPTVDHPCEQETTKVEDPPVTRPEDLAPQVKVQLRQLIETQRQAFRSACRGPASKRDELLATNCRCWEAICDLLEPSLPLEVKLPDEYRPRAIRQRGQIKAGVLNAIYDAISGVGETSAAHFSATNF